MKNRTTNIYAILLIAALSTPILGCSTFEGEHASSDQQTIRHYSPHQGFHAHERPVRVDNDHSPMAAHPISRYHPHHGYRSYSHRR